MDEIFKYYFMSHVVMFQVQFSPIPRKKIAYHPVLHHTIHYCEVSYCPNTAQERPIKRKPLVRSHSFAVSDLRERVDSEWNYKFRLEQFHFLNIAHGNIN